MPKEVEPSCLDEQLTQLRWRAGSEKYISIGNDDITDVKH